jgi:TetR/AcrR family transcriptional repressor of nem operon
MDEIFSASLEPLDRLKAYLAGIHRRSAETKERVGRMIGCPVASVGSEVSTQDGSVCAKTREILGRKRRYVESAMREAMANGSIEPGDPVKRTLVLASLIEGMMLQARMLNDPDILKDLVEMGLEIIRVTPVKPEPSAELAPALPEAS